MKQGDKGEEEEEKGEGEELPDIKEEANNEEGDEEQEKA